MTAKIPRRGRVLSSDIESSKNSPDEENFVLKKVIRKIAVTIIALYKIVITLFV